MALLQADSAFLVPEQELRPLPINKQDLKGNFGVKIPVEVGKTTEEWFEVVDPESLLKAGKEILVKGGFNLAGNR